MKIKRITGMIRRWATAEVVKADATVSQPADSPHQIFKTFSEGIKQQNLKAVQSFTANENELFEKCYNAIKGLSEAEKAYFFYRYYTEDPDFSIEEIRQGVHEDRNPFNPYQMSDLGFGGQRGSSQNANQKTTSEEAPQEAKIEEPVKEKKTHFDVELTSIDSAKKLAIIKELKNVLVIGLKDAKDLVEGGPVVLKKGLLMQDAEELNAKLTAIGCVITLK